MVRRRRTRRTYRESGSMSIRSAPGRNGARPSCAWRKPPPISSTPCVRPCQRAHGCLPCPGCGVRKKGAGGREAGRPISGGRSANSRCPGPHTDRGRLPVRRTTRRDGGRRDVRCAMHVLREGSHILPLENIMASETSGDWMWANEARISVDKDSGVVQRTIRASPRESITHLGPASKVERLGLPRYLVIEMTTPFEMSATPCGATGSRTMNAVWTRTPWSAGRFGMRSVAEPFPWASRTPL